MTEHACMHQDTTKIPPSYLDMSLACVWWKHMPHIWNKHCVKRISRWKCAVVASALREWLKRPEKCYINCPFTISAVLSAPLLLVLHVPFFSGIKIRFYILYKVNIQQKLTEVHWWRVYFSYGLFTLFKYNTLKP